jgi:hypothetical protein
MAYSGSTAAILSNYSEVLKTYYLPAIREQLNHDTILADILETNEEDVSGKDATINLHYGRTTGTGARPDGGALPEADYQKHQTCTVPTKYNYGRVTFSGPTIAATRDGKGAYARAIDTEISGCVTDFMMEMNRQYWGCGYGVLARWVSGTGTSIVIQKAYRNNSVGGDGFGSTFGAKYIKPDGNNAAVLLRLASTSSSVVTVTAIDSTSIATSAVTEGTTTDTITVTDPGTPGAGTYFIRPANSIAQTSASTAGVARYEMMGLRGIVTNQDLDEIAFYDGTNTGFTVNDPLQGLAVGTYSWWKAKVGSSATRYGAQRTLTFKLMDKMFDDVEEQAGKDYGPDIILTTRAIRREYKELCIADRRHVNTMTLDGGWKALEYNGIPLTVDNDAIDGEMYFLTTKDLAIYRMSDYDWMDKDGAILARLTGYDAYEAVLFRYAELATSRRNSQGVLCDLSYEL